MLELHAFINDMSDFFIKWDRFQIMEEDFLNVLCYSQHNGYRHGKHLSLIFINFFPIIFLNLDNQHNKSSHNL